MAEHAPIGTDMPSILAGLFDRCSRDALSDDDLLTLGGIEEVGINLVRNLGAVTQGIGCLVAHDLATHGRTGCGSLHDGESVERLMFLVSSVCDHVDGLFELSTAAQNERGARERERARQEAPQVSAPVTGSRGAAPPVALRGQP